MTKQKKPERIMDSGSEDDIFYMIRIGLVCECIKQGKHCVYLSPWLLEQIENGISFETAFDDAEKIYEMEAKP